MELSHPTLTLMSEISNKQFTRDDIATTYRMALQSSVPTDWHQVNQAILERWSVRGLEYIKQNAQRRDATELEMLIASFPKTRNCSNCASPFTANTLYDIYCSPSCRNTWRKLNG